MDMSNLLLCIQPKHVSILFSRKRWNKPVFCYKIAGVLVENSHISDTLSLVFSVTTLSCETIKVAREKEKLYPTNCAVSQNVSLECIEVRNGNVCFPH